MSCTQEPANQKHLLWIDAIKVLAAFLVILQHSISSQWVAMVSAPPTGRLLSRMIINLLFLLSKAGVPLFFMCSGACMLNKTRSIKQIWRHSIPAIIMIYAGWMLIYGFQSILDLIQNHHATIRTICNALIKNIIFGQYHTWFIAALVALYMITPFLCRISDDETMLRYFILLSIVFTILFPSFESVAAFDRFNAVIADAHMQFVVGYSLYYVWGYYLSQRTTSTKEKIILPTVLLAAICLAMYFSNAGIERGLGGDVQNYYYEFSICGFFICVCIFRMFMNADVLLKLNSAALPYRLINHLASCGMAIYLMHPLLLPLTQKISQHFALLGAVLLWLLSILVATLISITPLNRWLIKWKS